MSKHVDITKTEQTLLAIREGLVQVLAHGKTMPYRRVTYDLQGLLAIVDAFLEPFRLVNTDRTTLARDIEARRTNAPVLKDFVTKFKQAALVHFEEDSTEFVAFGFKPKKKPRPLTPEEQQLKVERARATRVARKTKGRRARQAIRGVVERKLPGDDVS
ncbi:MAG TPA: hypothetical protein VFF73_21155 [Planctomycetota bacterium]|nr:hypothetical protein [Planctomycetota bacterium]